MTDEEVKTCSDCDSEIGEDEETYEYDGNIICQSCRDDNYYSCDDCGGLVPSDESILVGDDIFCPDCVENDCVRCDDCGEYMRSGDEVSDGDITLCDTCYSNDYFTCPDCDHIYHTDDSHYSESAGESYCPDCYGDHDDEDEDGHPNGDPRIHGYGYVPTLKFFKLPGEDTNLFFGIELEIDEGDVSEYDFDLTSKHFWETYDCSVDGGHEVKSHPLSYNYIMAKKPFDSVCKMIKEAHYKSQDTDTCGLHIHLSRKAFDEDYTRRYLKAFIYLFEKFWREVVIFSRRKHDFSRHGYMNSIDEWAARHDVFDPNPNSYNYKSFDALWNMKNSGYGGFGGGRHKSINTTNTSTIEVRIFKGSINPKVIVACVQMVKYFFELSHFETPYLQRMTWYELREMGKEAYPEFSALCDKRGI